MTLEQEIATYKRELPTLAAHEGKYVLVHENHIVDIFGTYEDALKEGYGRFGLDPFLVRQIHAVEQTQYITREVEAV